MKSEAKEAATFKRLESRLQLPSVRTSRRELDQLLADDFVEFASSGATYNKRDAITDLLADPASARPRYATMENLKVYRLAEDLRLVTYRSRIPRPGATVPERANRSSIWKKADGRWQMLFHQGTPFGRSPAKKRSQ